MRVIVTGGAGFIGSHTVDILVEQGSDVLVVDDLSSGNLANLNPAAGFINLDISSPQLSEVFAGFRPDCVIHLAAQVSVARSVRDPVKDSVINVIGCVNLLENCRVAQVKKVIYASSAAVYGHPSEIVVSEDMSTLPLSCYGVSKLAPEYYLKVYYHLYGLRYTVLRYANVYGPRQASHGEGGVVAIFASKAVAGRNPVIFGDGEQTRDFVYVRDVALANVKAIRGADQTVLNIGTGVGTSVNRLWALIAQISGVQSEPDYTDARTEEIRHSRMDISKAMSILNWRPEMTLEEGLRKTVDYYNRAR